MSVATSVMQCVTLLGIWHTKLQDCHDTWIVHVYIIPILAVSTRPPAGDLSVALRALLSRPCGPLSIVFIALRAQILSALAGLCQEFY